MTLDWEKYLPDSLWAESVIDDAKEIGALMGFDISNIYWSGFWSQGDGACFEGTLSYVKGCTAKVREYAPNDAELHRIVDSWAAAQKKHFYSISGSVHHRGHYYHEHCTGFSFEDSRRAWGHTDDTFDESEFTEPARDFMRWIYKSLENEYEYAQAWALAHAWQDMAETMAEERAAMRTLVHDMRAAIKSGLSAAPSICAALRKQLRSHAEAWESARAARAEIDDNFSYWQGSKCMGVAEFAASYL